MSNLFKSYSARTDEQIREEVEKFRNCYPKAKQLPVPVVDIIEIDMQIEPVPIDYLFSQVGVIAFIKSDCTELWTDKERYYSAGWEAVSRHDLAHEIGHVVLHRDILKDVRISSKDSWMKVQGDNKDAIVKLEYQCDEFAGRLLVPRDILLGKIYVLRGLIRKMKKDIPAIEIDQIKSYIAMIIFKEFGILDKIVYERIVKEKIFEELEIS